MGPGSPVAVDLFSGAGGLALGVASAGVDVRAHVDSWEPAVETLRANFGEGHERLNVSDLDAVDLIELCGSKPDLLLGGPPCQSFTSAGRRDEADPRGTLVGAFSRLAVSLRPSLIVFENVEGFLTAGEGTFVHDLLEPLLDAGYCVRVRKVNLANYGVPQHRKRVFAVASLLGDPPFPSKTHSAWGAPGARAFHGLPRAPSVEEALAGLPEPGSNAGPLGHDLGSVSDLEVQRIAALLPGQTMRDLPDELQHDSYRRRAFRRVMDGTPTERRGGAPAGLRRLRGDQPSKAITSAATRELVHPTCDRRITLREAARLQTFPDDFTFCGTLSEQSTLIGNAVPPCFAAALGAALQAHLSGIRRSVPSPRHGALVEFTTTSGEAMSPALSRVVADVRDRYMSETLFAALPTYG